MRILFVVQDTGKLYGAERATVDLAGGLRAAGDDVCVLMIEESRLGRTESDFRKALEEASIAIERIPVHGRFSLHLVRAIRHAVQLYRTDVLHTTGYKADLHALFANGIDRMCPMVSTVHGWLFRPDLRERLYGWLNRLALRRFDAVIALTRFYERKLIGDGILDSRVHRIPSGIDPVPFSGICLPDAEQPFTLGLAGRLSEEKNIELFLHAAARAHQENPRLRFVLAGDGPLRADLERMCGDRGLSSVVSMPGFLSREDFLSRVHAVALTSRIENLPYVLMEAMAAGRPVLATGVGGVPDLVQDGITGLLIEPGNADGLTAAMLRLSRDPDLCRRLAAGASARIHREFSPAAWIASHRALYASLCADA